MRDAARIASEVCAGLFEHPYVDEERAKQVFFLAESLELMQTVAEHSFSLVIRQNAVRVRAPWLDQYQ
jgi:hypothetical protein